MQFTELLLSVLYYYNCYYYINYYNYYNYYFYYFYYSPLLGREEDPTLSHTG
jgi:hypothetical protein